MVGSEQIQPGINNANSMVGREQIHPGINNPNSTVGREQIQPGINNPNSMTGENQFRTQLEADKQAEVDTAIEELDTQMAKEIAGISGLRVDAYQRGYDFFDVHYSNANRQSFEGQIMHALGIDASQFSEADLREAFAQSTWVLDDAYDISVDKFVGDIETKYNGLKEEALLSIGNKYFALERIGELDGNTEITLLDWTNYDWNMDKRYQGYLAEQDKLVASIKKNEKLLANSEGDQKTNLYNELSVEYNRLDYLNDLLIDTDKALNGNIEDMSLSQLTIRAEYDFMNMLKTYEQEVIKESIGWFNEALDKWVKGDDSEIRDLILDMYNGEIQLEDIKDFNDLRSKYVQYAWESGIYDELFIERANELIYETIGPYFNEKANYEKTENGYKFDIPPNVAGYILDDYERKEQQQKEKGTAITVGGIVLGCVATIATAGAGPFIALLVGAAISTGGAVWGGAVSNGKDEWDDIAGAIQNHNFTGGLVTIEVVFGDDGEPEAYISDKKE